MNYEDKRVLAVPVSSMHTALSVINTTESAHLLRQIVPTDDGFWLIFKDDSWLAGKIGELMPGLKIVR